MISDELVRRLFDLASTDTGSPVECHESPNREPRVQVTRVRVYSWCYQVEVAIEVSAAGVDDSSFSFHDPARLRDDGLVDIVVSDGSKYEIRSEHEANDTHGAVVADELIGPFNDPSTGRVVLRYRGQYWCWPLPPDGNDITISVGWPAGAVDSPVGIVAAGSFLAALGRS